MRGLEILTLGTPFLALAVRVLLAEKRPSWIIYLPGVAILLIPVQLVVDGYRWQTVSIIQRSR